MAVGDGGELGYNSWMSIGEETAFGTAIASGSTQFIEFESESLTKKNERDKMGAINGTRDYVGQFLKNEVVGGNVTTMLNVAADGVVYLIKHAFGGTVTSANTSTNGVIHTLNLGDMIHNTATAGTGKTSLTFKKRIGSVGTFDFAGCRVNTLTLKGEINKPLMLSAELIGQHATATTDTPTVALTTITPLLWNGVSFKIGDPASMTDVCVSGTAETIQMFEFTLNNNLIAGDEASSLGKTKIDNSFAGKREITLKYTQRYDTTTAINRGFSSTAFAAGIILNSGQTIGAAALSTTYSMLIRMPRLYQETIMPVTKGPGLITQDIEARFIASSAGADLPTAVICNATANYQ